MKIIKFKKGVEYSLSTSVNFSETKVKKYISKQLSCVRKLADIYSLSFHFFFSIFESSNKLGSLLSKLDTQVRVYKYSINETIQNELENVEFSMKEYGRKNNLIIRFNVTIGSTYVN